MYIKLDQPCLHYGNYLRLKENRLQITQMSILTI